MSAKAIAALMVLAVVLVLGFVLTVMYAYDEISARMMARYPGVEFCPPGTQPFARYYGGELNRNLDIECFDVSTEMSPVGQP